MKHNACNTNTFQLQCNKEVRGDLYYGIDVIDGIHEYSIELCGLELYRGM